MNQPIKLVSLTALPAAGYEQPFEMLEACHERVHRMLGLLARLQAHVATHGADEQARQAARDLMRYFDQAAPQHHLDEERHVFPALLAAGDPALGRTVRQLMEDHGRMEALWAQARELLAALAEGRLSAFEPAHQAALREFASLYDRHIADEEQVAYPAARRSLDEADLAAMAGDMMRRRGVR